MGLGDFWLQSNNGKKISLESLQELKKNDLKGNSALIRIFNIFDTQNADGTKGSDGVLNKEELTSLFNTMSSAAKLKGNASIFEVDEAEDYINTTQTSEGQTLKQLGVKASDLFNFISALVPKNETHTTQVQSGVEALQQSYTPEEIEDLSIQTVTDDVRKARQIFNSQNENQGVVSDFVNGTKETFDTEFASSRVNRYLMREELCADLLAKSKSEEGLSEKEYLEAKINLAVSMLPKLKNAALRSSIIRNFIIGLGGESRSEQERIAEEMEIELLKDALRKLKPEDLTVFIQRVTAMPDAEYTEKAGQVVENMINQSLQEKIRDNQKPMADTNQVFIKHQPIPGSIEYIEQHSDAYKKMTFEETFEAERGVQYNQENIMDYAEKDAKMQFLLGMHNKRQQIYNILHDATVTVNGNNKLGAPDTRAIKPCEEQLESAIIQALKNLYGDDIEKMQEGLNKLGINNLKIIQSGDENDLLHPMKLVYDYENGDNPNPLIKKMDLGGYDLVNIANKLQNYVDTNYENALGGKTLEEYGQEVNSAYQMAYGARNAQHMAEGFAESQQEGVQTVKTAVQMGGMVVMVAGQLVPVGGQVATLTAAGIQSAAISGQGVAAAITMGGLATSTFGSVGVSALENFTKAGGATEEDKKEMLKELGVSLALVSSGMGIGKTSEAAFRALVIRNCPKLLAFASEVGIDATMSLVADYAITGQIDLSGEGIAQLQSILVGILHAKGNFKAYLNTHAGDVNQKPSMGLESDPNRPHVTGDNTAKQDNSTSTDPIKPVKDNDTPQPTNIKTQEPPKENTLSDNDIKLKNANLDDADVQKTILSDLEKEFPATRNVPGRVKVLKDIQKIMNDPIYAKLDETQRKMIKLIMLRMNPRMDAKRLLYDSELPSDIKRRLINIEECIKNPDNTDLAATLYKAEDYDIMIAIAKSIGIDESKIKQMEAAHNKALSNGCLLTYKTQIDTDNIQYQNINKEGRNYKVKVIDCTNPDTFKNPEAHGLPKGTTEENFRATVHMNDDFNREPARTIGHMQQSENLNLSATHTNGQNGLYGDQQIGILLDYDMGSVSYASNYAAGTGFVKQSADFAKAKLSLDTPSQATFVRERFIARMKEQGFEISTEDYAIFSQQFREKGLTPQELRNIAVDGKIDINGKKIDLSVVEKTLLDSTDDLMNISYEMRGQIVSNGFNEVNIYNPQIKAIYVRANSPDDTLESILSPKLLEYAEKKGIPIVFQRRKDVS